MYWAAGRVGRGWITRWVGEGTNTRFDPRSHFLRDHSTSSCPTDGAVYIVFLQLCPVTWPALELSQRVEGVQRQSAAFTFPELSWCPPWYHTNQSVQELKELTVQRWIMAHCLTCNCNSTQEQSPSRRKPLTYYAVETQSLVQESTPAEGTYPERPSVSIIQLQNVSVHANGGERWLFPWQCGAVVLSAAFLELEHRSSWDCRRRRRWKWGKPGQITYIHTHQNMDSHQFVFSTAIFIQALQWLPFILLLTMCSRLRDSESRTELKLTTTS